MTQPLQTTSAMHRRFHTLTAAANIAATRASTAPERGPAVSAARPGLLVAPWSAPAPDAVAAAVPCSAVAPDPAPAPVLASAPPASSAACEPTAVLAAPGARQASVARAETSPAAGASVAPGPAVAASLHAILVAPLAPGETALHGFARKEHELRAIFAALAPCDALALHRRLANPVPGDALAGAFGRLVVERRHRLLAFLADARRRAALRGATAA